MPTTYPNQVELTVAQILSERPSVRRFYNADNSNVVGDGVVFFDAAINADSTVVVSATANWTEAHIGKLLWIEGAGPDGTADLLTTIAAVNSPSSVQAAAPASFSVANAECRYGTDNTTGLQNAFDAAAVQRGLWLGLPRGIYLTTASLNLRNHLTIEGDGWCYTTFDGTAVSMIMCCADVPALQYLPAGEDDAWIAGNINRLAIRGTSRAGSKGLYSEVTFGMALEYLAFDHFGDQALHLSNGGFGDHISRCSATGSCLVRTGRTDYVGVFDINTSDTFIDDCEVACSTSDSSGAEYGDGFIAAIAVRGNNSWVRDCMGHHSQIGFYIGSRDNPQVVTTLVNCRADRNQGHGFIVDAYNCNFLGCRAHANGLDADGVYDGFHITFGSHQFHGVQVTTQSSAETIGDGIPTHNRLLNGFYLDTGSFFPPSLFNYCNIGNAFSGSRLDICTGAFYHAESGTRSPIVLDYEYHSETDTYRLRNTVPVNMDKDPIHFRATAGDANTRNWSIGPDVSGAPNVFNIAAWNDALNSFVFPFALYRNQTTGAVDYIRLSQAAHVLINAVEDVSIDAPLHMGAGRNIHMGAANHQIISSTGDPNGVHTAVGGSLVLDGSGGLWIKISGVDANGWAKPLTGIIDLFTQVSGILAVANGGTAGANAGDARFNLDVYSKAEVDAAIAAAVGGVDFSSLVTKTQHNAHDHFYTGDGSGTVSDHTSTANPTL